MKKLLVGIALLSCSSFVAQADEDYNHFPSLEAPDIKTAYCNLQEYNQKLLDITSKEELDTVDMVKVHELTYTIENAVIRYNETIAQAAVELEEVHLASERMDKETVKNMGAAYQSRISEFLSTPACD